MHASSSPVARCFRSGLRRLVLLSAGLGVLLAGCVSMRSVPLPVPGQPAASVAVKVGDRVRVQTRTGESFEFKVTAIESDALVGMDRRVRFDEMSGLQVKHLDKLRTGGAVAGTTIGVAVIVVLVVLATGGFAIMSGP
jgi:hypothetical protein